MNSSIDDLLDMVDEWKFKFEAGLEHSRVLVLCMSAHAFGSDWAQLEAGTFRFRDPLNQDRRFIPLRLDDAPIKGSLAQFLYINWLLREREQEYANADGMPAVSAVSDLKSGYVTLAFCIFPAQNSLSVSILNV